MQQSASILHKEQVLRGMEHIPEGEQLPALILFHGFTGTKLEPHRLFLKISRSLEEKGIASFRFDFLGSGESDGDFEEMTVLKELDQAKSILEYVKAHPSIDENKISVLGFSMGGLVASLLAGEALDQIDRLLLIASAGNMPEEAKIMGETSKFIEEKDAYDIDGNLISKYFIDELQNIDVWGTSAKFDKDVLLIHGTNDHAVDISISEQYVEKCYGERGAIVAVEGADHTFNSYEWEKKVIRSILEFMGSESKRI